MERGEFMNNLDREMSYFLGAAGAPLKTQLRTRYFDDVVKMSKKGYSDIEIDRSLIAKLIKESPEEAASILGGGMSREEVENTLQDIGVDLKDIDEEELERLRKLGSLLKGTGNKNNLKSKQKFFNTERKFLLKSIVSAWFIWALIIFSLNAIDIMSLYREEEYFAWLVLPPIIGIAIFIWIRKFVLKK